MFSSSLTSGLLWLALVAGCAVAQDNSYFDPSDYTIPTCTVSTYQDETNYPTAADATCSAVSGTVNISTIETLASMYAPVVFFSPLEEYTLADPMKTFEGTGSIVDSSGTIQDTLDLSTLDLTNTDMWVERELTDAYKAGEGFDDDGVSQAPVYFSYADLGDNVWVFNYYYYFAYVGRLTMGFATTTGGEDPYDPFQVPPFGVHDGAWETISVMVCATDDTSDPAEPLAVHYFGLGQSLMTDCTAGECMFYTGTTTHPVAFSVMNTHSMYPYPSMANLMGLVDITSFGLPNKLYIQDITNFEGDDGEMYYFMPTTENIKWINETEDIWQFAGRWGKSTGEDISPEFPLYCTNADATEYVDCVENQALSTILGLFDTVRGNVPDGLLDETLLPLVFQAAKGDYGPVYFDNYDRWLGPNNAPIWDNIGGDTDTAAYCEEVGVDSDEAGSTPVAAPTRAPTRNRATSGGRKQGIDMVKAVSTLAIMLFLLVQ